MIDYFPQYRRKYNDINIKPIDYFPQLEFEYRRLEIKWMLEKKEVIKEIKNIEFLKEEIEFLKEEEMQI